MEIKIEKEDVEKMIDRYYSEFEGRNVKSKIQCSVGSSGIFAKSKVQVIEIINDDSKLDNSIDLTYYLKAKDLKNIFSVLLEKEDYIVKNVCFNDEAFTGGDAMCYGIILNVKKQERVKTKSKIF